MLKVKPPQNPFASPKSWHLPATVILIGIVITALLIIFKPDPEQSEPVSKAMAVNALTVRKRDITIEIPSQGRVAPRVKTILTTEISGNVIAVSDEFVNGGFVRKGQLLLRLDDRNYRAAVKRAEADVAKFDKLLIQEKAQAQVAYKQWKSNQNVKRTPEALSLLLRKPQLKEAEASLEFARVELERAQADLQKTVIEAPFDGIIKQKFVDYAQYVVAGTNIAELVGIEYAEIRLAIPQDRLAYLNLPDFTQLQNADATDTAAIPDAKVTGADKHTPAAVPVTLESDFGEYRRRWQANIIRSEGLFDDKNYSLYVVAEVRDPYNLNSDSDSSRDSDEPLLMGTYVEASITGRQFQDIATLPRHALRAGNHVWIIDENNRLQSRQLEILRIGGDIVYVTSGLKDGDRVCLTHVGEVVPGTPVRITQENLSQNSL